MCSLFISLLLLSTFDNLQIQVSKVKAEMYEWNNEVLGNSKPVSKEIFLEKIKVKKTLKVEFILEAFSLTTTTSSQN